MTKQIELSIEQLTEMKERVTKSGKAKATAEGEQKALLTGLKSEHGISGLKQLGTKIDSYVDRLESLEEEITDGVKSLREDYNWE